MKMHNLDRLFLMPFHEVYLLNYIVSYYGASIPKGSNHCHSPFMNAHKLRSSSQSMQFLAHSVANICYMSIKTYSIIQINFLSLLFLITSLPYFL